MPKKLERCVEKVKRNSPNANPYAVCAESTGWVRKKGGGWVNKRTGKKFNG